MKALKIESLLNWLKANTEHGPFWSSVHASQCCACPQLCAFSLEQEQVVSNLWREMGFEGEMRPMDLALLWQKHFYHLRSITVWHSARMPLVLFWSTAHGALKGEHRSRLKKAGGGGWSLLWVWTQVSPQSLNACTPAAVPGSPETGITEMARKAGMGGYDPVTPFKWQPADWTIPGLQQSLSCDVPCSSGVQFHSFSWFPIKQMQFVMVIFRH